jgi:transposase
MHNRKHQINTQAAQQEALSASSVAAKRPDPEVVPSAKRRIFSKAEKLRILAAADACVAPGDIGALLRREGIYSSHLATWRKQRQLADEAGAMERKRGPKVDPAAAEARRVRELEKEVERLRAKLAKADLIIDVQKKLSTLLGLSTGDMPSELK